MTQAIKQASDDILCLCEQPNSALQAIHKVMQAGGASERAFGAIYQRVMTDKDAQGAYYLVALAQKVDDLPIDVVSLTKLVIEQGDGALIGALLHKLPDDIADELCQKHQITR